jgi:hypothetical protein
MGSEKCGCMAAQILNVMRQLPSLLVLTVALTCSSVLVPPEEQTDSVSEGSLTEHCNGTANSD